MRTTSLFFVIAAVLIIAVMALAGPVLAAGASATTDPSPGNLAGLAASPAGVSGKVIMIGAGVGLMACLGLGFAVPNLRDTGMKVTTALMAGATAVTGTAMDTGNVNGEMTGNVEFLLSVPALTITQCPDTKTITYDVVTSAAADMSGPTILMPGIIVQTGATATPAAAATYRFRLPTNAQRYVAIRATGTSTVAATDANMTLEALF